MFFGKDIELQQTCVQKVSRAQPIISRIVVEGRGNLNQALQEHFLGIWRLEPDFFPMFMRVIEMRRIKRIKSFLEQPIHFMMIHRPTEAE